MSFSEISFILFFIPLVLLIAILPLGRGKTSRYYLVLVLSANIIFYVFAGYRMLLFLLLYALINYLYCMLCRRTGKKAIYIICTVILLIPLIFVKYFGDGILVPLGISFYTFQAVSVLTDIFRGSPDDLSLLRIITYLTFFPTVTSGPILRYRDFCNGLLRDSFDAASIEEGMERFVTGLAKKLLIADKIAPLADYYFDGIASMNEYSVAGVWLGSIAYTVQIYLDFSGYSDMAIGLGRILGIRIPENFNHPYRSGSISEFWRSWHISLSDWFRDYIYIPLGGSRCSYARHIFNMLVVWLVTSVWHGNDISFIVWGMGHLVLLLLEKYIPGYRDRLRSTHIFGKVYVLFWVNMLWVAFRCDNIYTMCRYYINMFSFGNVGCESIVRRYLPFLIVLLILFVLDIVYRFFVDDRIKGSRLYIICKQILFVILFMVCVGVSINSAYTPYVYGRF